MSFELTGQTLKTRMWGASYFCVHERRAGLVQTNLPKSPQYSRAYTPAKRIAGPAGRSPSKPLLLPRQVEKIYSLLRRLYRSAQPRVFPHYQYHYQEAHSKGRLHQGDDRERHHHSEAAQAVPLDGVVKLYRLPLLSQTAYL